MNRSEQRERRGDSAGTQNTPSRGRLRRTFFVLWPLTVAVTLVLFACNLWFGDLNQDEGWYLYAGRMVAEGKLPFIDFASTQGPVMSFVYALAWPIVRLWGVAGGRLYTACLGFACAAASAGLACRVAGTRRGAAGTAALLTFVFVGVNVYQSYFCTIVKTYSLSGLLLVVGFLFLTCAERKRCVFPAAGAGVFLSLAAAVRLSAAVTLPVVFAVLLCTGLKHPVKHTASELTAPPEIRCRRSPAIAVWFLIGSAVTCCAVFLPFLLKARTATLFGLVEYHAGREVGSALTILAYKAGFIARQLRAYFVPLSALVAALICTFTRRSESHTIHHSPSTIHNSLSPIPLALWLSIIAMTLVHLLAPFPYDDYQVMIFPLFAAALSVFVADLLIVPVSKSEKPATSSPPQVSIFSLQSSILSLLFLLNLLAALSSPMVQNWLIGPRDRMWWPLKEKTPLARLRETGRLVRSLAGPGELLLTQDAYLAVEAGLRVPEGLELGPFSYFPDWDPTRAGACHVLSRESLRELLATTDAPVAAFSGYGLSIRSPSVQRLPAEEQQELWNIVRSRYKLHSEIKDFGQAGTRLRLLVRRDGAVVE